MKKIVPLLFSALLLCLGLASRAASVITNNYNLTLADTSYEGADVVISNCTVALDGAHTFNSLFIGPGGVLTHTAGVNGSATITASVTNEPLVLNDTNLVTLFYSYVNGLIALTDTNQNLFTNGADFIQTVSGNNQTQISRTTNSAIPDGAALLANYVWRVSVTTGVNLNLTNDLTVAVGGSLNANALGIGVTTGNGRTATGSFADGSGAGHAGNGGMSLSNALGGIIYGTYNQPTTLGSSGGASYVGAGGTGGGRIQITAGGNVTINGAVSANAANGTNSRSGGGSGGSIRITAANNFSGNGSVSANGGAGEPVRGGGGGGGRIAIQFGANNFTGLLAAFGGAGAKNGGAGTVYLRTNNQTATIVFDNGGLAGTNSVFTPIGLNDIIVRNGAWLTPSSAGFSAHNLTIGTNGILAMASATALSLNPSGDFIIRSGGQLLADNLGYASGTGTSSGGAYPGNTGIYYSGGGGHGGYGGMGSSSTALAGSSYDNHFSPTAFGSGGGGYTSPSFGGAGGGAFQLSVGGTLQVDGKISANGGNGSGTGGGGGAGGSIYIASCATLTGGGSISANGGTGVPSFGGGGGGGRIAAYFNSHTFTGTFSTSGGSGVNNGGAGTTYLKTTSAPNGIVIMDNAGNPGAFTTWINSSTTDLMLRNGGVCYLSSSATFGNLTVGSNTTMIVSNSSPSQITLTAVSVNLQAGGSINADTAGYAAGVGISSGQGNSGNATLPYYACSGAGHGGYGSASIYYDTATIYGYGGNYYDTQNNPSLAGGGGGNLLPYSFGGKGGGALRFAVTGNMQLDGSISANAGSGSGLGGGGGSGGSVNIACADFAGAGNISANGGNSASSTSGGGAGGMIFASFNASSFSGNATAFGGTGYRTAAAGTIFFQTNSGQSLLIVDNGGRRGTNTLINLNYNANNWIIRNGALAQPSGSSFTINSLFVGSNSVLLPYISNGSLNFTVNGNTTLQPGSGIIADSFGSTPNNGVGRGTFYTASPYYSSGGGGHGGYGGNGTNYSGGNGVSGTTYDSTTSPISLGSGGGNFGTTYSTGGSGGGYVRLIVNGTLQQDGFISANGGNGTLGGGGGAGGSIYISVAGAGSFKGAGTISANGGNGGPFGGGGGGGRIAIYYYSNVVQHSTFNGSITAFGGGGQNFGGAGTIYLQNYSQGFSQLIFDNNGNAGTNTTFDSTFSDVTVRNRAVASLNLFSVNWNSLTIRTNATLLAPYSASLRTIVANNITVDAGGLISFDATGNTASTGTGFALNNQAVHGGAGYGGYGGGNAAGFGRAYGSIIAPTLGGSGGGSGFSGGGGSGGGALTLNVSSKLIVNGRISANGDSGYNGSGGGSGGSLNLASINNFSGNGIITANGGASGGGAAGGGGGGRIALIANASTFTGQFTATGGGGTFPGGAGTIYTRINGNQILTVDNGNLAGTNTPLGSAYSSPSSPFDLNISGQAVVAVTPPLPLLNNFNLAASSTLTLASAPTSLLLAAQANANIFGNVLFDNLGHPQAIGAGAGGNANSIGAGGGHGGRGGNSANGAGGGNTNGSATQPTSYGSGGGPGVNTITGGSEGGGVVRLSIGGNLNLSGNISANGDFGWQDNSGGGAGGSIWITANSISGLGNISAAGGNGDLWNGGGGGGGRIAIYSPTNLFTGSTNVSGGFGAFNGQVGTIFLANSFLDFSVVSQSPTGTVNDTVSYVDLNFSDAVDPASVAAAAFTLTTPAGALDTANLTAATTSATSVRVSFPLQNLLGAYTLTAGVPLASILGQTVQNFTGTFTLALATVSGTVSDTNGAPVPGVTIAPNGGLIGAITDTNGFYSIGVPPGWNGGLTPTFGAQFFIPGTLLLTNVTASLTNQNFLMLPSLTPTVAAGLSGTNLALNWNAIAGVTYQVLYSTDLVNWAALATVPPASTNGAVQFLQPPGSDPAEYFRLLTAH